ncbi:MAG: fused MFS/spermidine synthase, partial [Planctomycetota bacterium]|nr:fused MFS/spermidine synthase [Planctomycetota bacterium]
FLTGMSAIASEVCWVRLLQPVLGGTAEATAAVISVHLAGLAAGAYLLGRRSSRVSSPARGFALLQGVAGAILLASPSLFVALGGGGPLGLVLLFLPALLLGGTWPLLAATIPSGAAGAGTGALSLAHNLGGAAGGLFVGFLLMPAWGISTGLIASGGCLILGASAGFLFLRPEAQLTVRRPPLRVPAETPVVVGRWVIAYGLAGLLFLGIEIVWTRLFSLFFQNTVYSFAAVLAVYLIGAAVGAAMATRSADRIERPARLAGIVIILASSLGMIPFLAFGPLLRLQKALREIPTFDSHGPALVADVAMAAILVLPATIAMGYLFPLVGRIVGQGRSSLGAPIGGIYTAGTFGSVLGGPLAGFLLIPTLGIVRTIQFLAALGWIIGIWGIARAPAGRRRPAATILILAIFPSLAMILEVIPTPGEAALLPGETIIEYREGRSAHASVIRDADGFRRLKVNRSYSMGGDLGVRVEKRQGILPVLIHPGPRRALVIGLGTGVTLGAAAGDPDLDLVCVEILPEVIALSDRFRDDHGGVASHPRIRLIQADGRTYLRESSEKWDLIISDLFFPWRPGVGPLYAREHFETARGRLEPGGIYWQWFALHQLTLGQVRILCRTFSSVFPEVELWIAEISGEVPVAGLVGMERPRDLEVAAGISRFAGTDLEGVGLSTEVDILALRICGSDGVRTLGRGAVLHTDDRPVIEFDSPSNFFADPIVLLRPNLQAMIDLLERPARDVGLDPLETIREAAAWSLRGEVARLGREPVVEMQAQFRAMQILPELSRPREAILHRARTYISASRPESALRILRTYLESAPDDAEALRLREEASGENQ